MVVGYSSRSVKGTNFLTTNLPILYQSATLPPMNQLPLSLILLSGLPGCGKTTLAHELARRLHTPLFAKDRVQRVLKDQISGTQAIDGYYVLLDLTDEQLALGISVIVDAVFPKSGFRREAEQLAHHYGAHFKPIYCYCSDEHLWKKRMENREQLVKGWTPVDWSEVERLRPLFEPWEDMDILNVDSATPLAANIDLAMRYILNSS